MPTIGTSPHPAPRLLSRLLCLGGVSFAAAGGVLAAAGPAAAVSPNVVIAEVYGGGGNSGSTFKNDFVELYNTGTDAVDLSGWTIQYASAAGTFSTGNSTVLPSGTTIAAGRYFLIQEAAGSGGTTSLPTPDATGSLNLSATAGKVALATTATVVTGPTAANVRDFVGFGTTANAYEGSGPAPAPSNSTSDTRNAGPTNTPLDSDDNAKDFTAGTVTATNMAGTTSSGTAAATNTCTTAGTTSIEAIEGSAITSPLAGSSVTCVPGIVTGTAGSSYWIQDPAGDGNADTSDGLYVFSSTGSAPAVGSSVLVSGSVTNYAAGFSDDYQLNIQTPELTSPTATVLSTGNALPAPVVIGNQTGDELPPRENVSSDTGDVEAAGMAFDRTTDALDFWRSLLSMRVQVRDARVVGPSATGGHGPSVVPGDGVDAGVATPTSGVLYDSYADPNTRVIQTYDDAVSGGLPATSVGDTDTSTSSPVVGIIDFFGNPQLELTQQPAFTSGGLTPQTTPYAGAGPTLSVATYNVENLNPQNPAGKFSALAGQIVNNLRSPNLIAVEEVQDNDGVTDDGVTSAATTLSMLESAISNAGGPSYSSTEIDPANDADGGQPGGNIRQVFLYDPSVVTLVAKPGGGTTVADTVVTDPDGTTKLAQSPGRIDPTDSAWNASRKPLAAEFTLNATGRRFFAIGNHFIAKLGDAPLYARTQPPAMASAQQRITQATAVNSFVQQLEADPNASVVVMGDFNDFAFSASQQTLRGTQLRDLFTKLPANQQYDYDYAGNSQTLDHILVSGPLFDTASFAPVHVNAEFANQVSDHDPEVALVTPGASAPPAASLPESPVALLVPLAGLAALGAVSIRRRRHTEQQLRLHCHE